MSQNSFGTREKGNYQGKPIMLHSLKKLREKCSEDLATLPFSLFILLENLLRYEDGKNITKDDIEAVLRWDPNAKPSHEIQFTPSRVLLQDFTGVPVVADLTAMRNEVKRRGKDPALINPIQPVDLVVDHSVQVDSYGNSKALLTNSNLEFKRNWERYELLKWAQQSFRNFRVVPPATGICHQVNLEYLASVVSQRRIDGEDWIFPDTVVGTDSHTPMVNGLGVLGWGVGGIEAEAAMLGQPCSMLIPQVIGVKFTGQLRPGATATDVVLTITQVLRKKGVVGQFVEYFGPGISSLSIADRATVSNMVPEYGATVGLFPVDERTLDYLRMTGREEEAERVKWYYEQQGFFFDPNRNIRYSDVVEINLSEISTVVAGPSKPHDRSSLSEAHKSWRNFLSQQGGNSQYKVKVNLESGSQCELSHGSIVIAAITSCTNTSNPSLMLGAALLARNAHRLGLKPKPWVKTSFAPGSPVVTDYLEAAGLLKELEALNFHLVGYGCTTCIGNSGPLPASINQAIEKDGLITASVLSGNRNFEARIHPSVAANYLMSPPLVVAYSLVGHIDIDLEKEPLGKSSDGRDVYLKDIWPSPDECRDYVQKYVEKERFERIYKNIFQGSDQWRDVQVSEELIYPWNAKSTYIQEPPFPGLPPINEDITGARVLAYFGDFITTDHISPAGGFKGDSAAGSYLMSLGVAPEDFNSYGARRGNHEVMWRGTFANVRLQNKLTPDKKGGWTRHFPSNEVMNIFEASKKYTAEKVPLIVVAGKEYGSGSSRDWAAKGVRLLGVRAILAQGFERIHRSNLVGMGVAPLEFMEPHTPESLGLTGEEVFSIRGLDKATPRSQVEVSFTRSNGESVTFPMLLRIDTPIEMKYYKRGGVLPYVLEQVCQ